MNDRWNKFNEAELKEISCGLGWSSSESQAIDYTVNDKLDEEIKEALKKYEKN